MDTPDAIKLACKEVGGQANLARRLGVRPPTVAQWALPNYHPKNRPVPVRYCLRIVEMSSVKVWHLRPDDWYDIWPAQVGQPGAPAPQKAAA